MKPDPALTAKLAEYHSIAGFLIFSLGWASKDILPKAVGLLPTIQFPCAFFSSVLIPLGSFLTLCVLLNSSHRRRAMLGYHVSGLIFIIAILSFYFFAFLMMNRVIDITNQVSQPSALLSKLTENARSFPTGQKRMGQAQWAYKLYGVIIAYRPDNLQVAYYTPTDEDIAFRLKQEHLDAQTRTMTDFIKKMTGQFPYLFGLYAATFATTYIVGGIWLLVRVPTNLPQAAS